MSSNLGTATEFPLSQEKTNHRGVYLWACRPTPMVSIVGYELLSMPVHALTDEL